MSLPLISVIIVTYNRANLIKEAIQSVLSQTYSDFELLIVDDGSTDNTPEIVKSYSSSKIRYIYKKHSNLPDSRNFALKYVRGEYLVWLDSDDFICPEILDLEVKEFIKNPEIDLVFTDHHLIDKYGKIFHRYYYWKENNLPSERDLILKSVLWTPICLAGAMVKKTLYDDVGGFDPSFDDAEDHEFLNRAIPGHRFKGIGLPLYKRRIHNSSKTHVRHRIKFKAEVLRRMLKRYSIKEMFPELQNESLAYLELGKIFMDREAYYDSVKYFCRSFFYVPNLSATKGLVRLIWRLIFLIYRKISTFLSRTFLIRRVIK